VDYGNGLYWYTSNKYIFFNIDLSRIVRRNQWTIVKQIDRHISVFVKYRNNMHYTSKNCKICKNTQNKTKKNKVNKNKL